MDEQTAKEIKRRHSERLLKIPGVHGVGLESDAGSPVLAIYLAIDPSNTHASFPDEIEGLPVRLQESGPFNFQAEHDSKE